MFSTYDKGTGATLDTMPMRREQFTPIYEKKTSARIKILLLQSERLSLNEPLYDKREKKLQLLVDGKHPFNLVFIFRYNVITNSWKLTSGGLFLLILDNLNEYHFSFYVFVGAI